MEENEFKLRTTELVSPSGHTFVIREQNGEDEDTLSNPKDSKNLMNLTKFITSIVVSTNFTSNGKLTVEDALDLPLLDRYFLLMASRIFSIGEEIEFEYTWDDGKKFNYTDDLSNYVFDYSKRETITQEELDAKPNAIPFYPEPASLANKVITLSSGKVISYSALTGRSEMFALSLPEEKKTRNAELLSRNLKLQVNGEWEKVQNFKLFSVKDMTEIRKSVKVYDPTFTGFTELENPVTNEKIQFPIMAASTFFFPTEI